MLFRLTHSETDQDSTIRPRPKRRIPRISVFELEAVVQLEEDEESPCLDPPNSRPTRLSKFNVILSYNSNCKFYFWFVMANYSSYFKL